VLNIAAMRTAGARVWLIVQAWLALAAFDVALLAGFARVHDRIRRCPVRRVSNRPAVDDVVWAVDEACVWYVKRAACLQRSAVATWLLRRHGVPAALVIGYRPVPFESHAWVEVDGAIVNDRPQYQRVFAVLDRL
jgi:hypothetical protein